jgi:hypothetical protein
MIKHLRPKGSTVHPLYVTLDSALSRADRSRFYKRMRRSMRRAQLFIATTGGFCLCLGAPNCSPKQEREALVDWLIDQPVVRRVELLSWQSVDSVLEELSAADDGDGDGRLHERVQRFMAQRLIRRLLTGALVQAFRQWRLGEGA